MTFSVEIWSTPNYIKSQEDIEDPDTSFHDIPMEAPHVVGNRNISQITLGELLNQLESIDSDKPIMFDNGKYPEIGGLGIYSYRGYYCHACMQYKSEYERVTVANMIAMLKNKIGDVRTGYKGGDYYMNPDVPVWMAEYGRAEQIAIVEVDGDGYTAIIRTWLVDN